MGAMAVAAGAFGAAAIGALAIGALAVRRLKVMDARLETWSWTRYTYAISPWIL